MGTSGAPVSRSAITQQVKTRLDTVLEGRRETHADLIRMLDLSVSGYYGMWKDGTVPLAMIMLIARFLDISPAVLLDAPAVSSMASEPQATYGRPRFLEERVADLERELVTIRRQLQQRKPAKAHP